MKTAPSAALGFEPHFRVMAGAGAASLAAGVTTATWAGWVAAGAVGARCSVGFDEVAGVGAVGAALQAAPSPAAATAIASLRKPLRERQASMFMLSPF